MENPKQGHVWPYSRHTKVAGMSWSRAHQELDLGSGGLLAFCLPPSVPYLSLNSITSMQNKLFIFLILSSTCHQLFFTHIL